MTVKILTLSALMVVISSCSMKKLKLEDDKEKVELHFSKLSEADLSLFADNTIKFLEKCKLDISNFDDIENKSNISINTNYILNRIKKNIPKFATSDNKFISSISIKEKTYIFNVEVKSKDKILCDNSFSIKKD